MKNKLYITCFASLISLGLSLTASAQHYKNEGTYTNTLKEAKAKIASDKEFRAKTAAEQQQVRDSLSKVHTNIQKETTQVSNLTETIGKNRQEKQRREASLKNHQVEGKSIVIEKTAWQDSLAQQQSQLQALSTRKEEEKTILGRIQDSLSAVSAQLSAKSTAWKENQAKIEALQKEKAQAEQNYQKDENLLKEKEASLALVKDSVKNSFNLLHKTSQTLDHLLKDHHSSVKKLEDNQTAITDLTTKRDQATKEQKESEKELAKLNKELAPKRKALNNPNLSHDELHTLKQEVNKGNHQAKQLEDKQKGFERDIIKLNASIKQHNDERKQLEAHDQKMLSDIDSLQTQYALLEGENKGQSQRRDILIKELERLKAEQHTLHASVKEAEHSIHSLTKEGGHLQKELEETSNQQQAISKRITAQQERSFEASKAYDVVSRKTETSTAKIQSLEKSQQANLKLQALLPASIDSLGQLILSEEDALHQTQRALENNKHQKEILQPKLEALNAQLQALENKSEDILLAGIQLGLAKDLEGASKKFSKAKETANQNPMPFYLAGYTDYMLNKSREALVNLEQMITIAPKDFRSYLLRAEINKGRGDYLGASEDYSLILFVDSLHTEARYQRAILYNDYLNEFDRACKDWTKGQKNGDTRASQKLAENCGKEVKRYYSIHQITGVSNDEVYGSQPEKPIQVGTSENPIPTTNIEAYLSLLRDAKGNPVEFIRQGSCCPHPSKNGLNGQALLERYLITYRDEKGKKQQKTLYFTYYDYDKPVAPQGFQANTSVDE